VIAAHKLPWHVVNVGARVEFVCAEMPSTNGSEARAAMQPRLEAAIHLYLANRGILLAPFHNMMLLSPATQEGQVDRWGIGSMCHSRESGNPLRLNRFDHGSPIRG
jgi:glutamate-1-semialdehyde 2,1-aminomutase